MQVEALDTPPASASDGSKHAGKRKKSFAGNLRC